MSWPQAHRAKAKDEPLDGGSIPHRLEPIQPGEIQTHPGNQRAATRAHGLEGKAL